MQAHCAPATSEGTPPVPSVLIVDDDKMIRDLCCDLAADANLRVTTAADTEEALEVLQCLDVDLVVTDIQVPLLGGLKLIQLIRACYPEVGKTVLTQYGTIRTAIEATRLGAIDYITKPFHTDEFLEKLTLLAKAAHSERQRRLLSWASRSHKSVIGLIGESPQIECIKRIIPRISQHDYPVLILGESGTGKEVTARSIHLSSPRAAGPFVPVDCCSLTPSLVESELFGHVRGAFTGASQRKTGLIEAANTGTLFLDEIGELPKELQAKLLRAIQEKEIRSVGATQTSPVNVRIIAATNRDLGSEISAGRFRQDLYYRLNVVQLTLPPLRERKADIPLLVSAFIDKYQEGCRKIETVSPRVWSRLLAHDWPGNVRELENAIERAMALGSGPILHVGDLPSNLHYPASERAPEKDELLPLEELERRAILRTLRETGGDKLAAARMLGIGKTTLYRKLKQYHMEQAEL